MQNSTRNNDRPRVLLLAYSCHPQATMESRVGWHRALQAAARYETCVLYGEPHDQVELAAWARDAGADVRFVRVPHTRLSQKLSATSALFWNGYELWQRQAYRMAKLLHSQTPFDLIHQIGFCGYREPGYAWKLDVPFVLGPVGGTQNYPWRFLGEAELIGGMREVARNVANGWQIRRRKRVRRAMNTAAAVLAANRTNQRDVLRVLGIRAHCQLETGIDTLPNVAARQRQPHQPLRVLWAGRFQTWKALPLLLKALGKLPTGCRYELRVLGEGPCEKSWKRLADRLGISPSIQWLGWPSYRQTLREYRWADVFAFTSLRDTSGTGLLEALAAGAPIVGVDHQGAADIVNDQCAIRVPVRRPAQTIAAFRDALALLADDPDQLHQLSAGALRRANHFMWDRQGERMDMVYQSVLGLRESASLSRDNVPTSHPSAVPTHNAVGRSPVRAAFGSG